MKNGHKAYTVCLLFTDDLEKVLLQEKQKTDFAGKLNGVGGKIKPGETPERCALRKIWEETGVRYVTDLTWIGSLSLPNNCDTHAESDDINEPACILHYYAGLLRDAKDIPHMTDGANVESLCFAQTQTVINTNPEHPYLNLAGDGNLQYFVGQALQIFQKKKG